MHLFCFGVGRVGLAWLEAFQNQGICAGTTTKQGKISYLSRKGINILLFVSKSDNKLSLDTSITHILVTIPPDTDTGDSVINMYRETLISLPNLEWVGVLSSTGVYGDHQGDWVTEESPCHPSSLRAQARLKSEQHWLDLWKKYHLPVHIFRLSGIYGVGKSLIDSVREGTAKRIHKPGVKFSRIHLEDIITVLKASMAHPNPGGIYNLADDLPIETEEIIKWICETYDLPLPPETNLADPHVSPMLCEFYKDKKRVCNMKIRQELGITLKYPTFKEGLS